MSDTPSPLCRSHDSLLLLIDIQARLTAAMPAKVLARLQRNVSMLLKSAAALDIPVLATEQYPQGLGPLEPALAALLPGDSRCFPKTCFSCAAVPELLQALADSGRRQVVMVGMEAHICVLQSAMDLRAAGYGVFVVADAVCSRQRESYETALQRLRGADVAVCDAESVLFEWLEDAAHPRFKDLQPLIR